jgi:hypothetical protein
MKMSDDTEHKFEPDDAGRYIAIKDGDGLIFGIVTDVLDEEDARVWYPNVCLEAGGRGTSCIVNIKEVEAFGWWRSHVLFPEKFMEDAHELQRIRLEAEDA